MIKKKSINIQIYENSEELSSAAAQKFVELANKYIRQYNKFMVALSGGSTPKIMFRKLIEQFSSAIEWDKICFFWSDERYVPIDHADSNAGMAMHYLFKPLNIKSENIHFVQTELDSPTEAATLYENTIREKVYLSLDIPRFDLILLGLGDDGHTASLFPGTDALREKQKMVSENWIPKLKKWRITFTFSLLNSAKNIIFLISGENKSAVIDEIVNNIKDYPATHVKPVNGEVTWMLDSAAGKLLPKI